MGQVTDCKRGILMMLRKTVPAVAVAAMLTLTACGGSDSGTSTSAGGVKTGIGVTDTEINLGLLSDYSGPLAQAATSGTLGMQVQVDAVNAAGGICGRQLVLHKMDTKYDPQVATQQYRAINNKVLMMPQLVGTPAMMAIKDNIAKDNMPTFASSLNTSAIKLDKVSIYTPPFEVELINGLVWAAQEAGASAANPLKVAVITPADQYGEIYAGAVKFAADKIDGVEVVASATYTPTDNDFTAQVADLKQSGAQVVILGNTMAQTAGIVGQSAQLDFKPKWVGYSAAWNAALAKPLAGLMDNIYVSASYGVLADDVQGIADMKAALAKYAPNEEPSNFQVVGWLSGVATQAVLEKACENKDLTRDGVLAAMENLDVDFGGILPAVNLKDGDSIVSYETRVNRVDANGMMIPVADFKATDEAKAWGEANGF
ncbi:ABC transporter substrate-binding protein [Rhodococcus sp. OK302]|uniref:ABC transporter substrate-binding protein n=1 Tax=Rhodococcus sp. OK302 TaxID=1882769 RepID=UPI000B9F7F1D|nr:ABC transporter substrate-binding protein [Rhodococcus sp. OK302]OYD68302.1 amino acid/amide ABC transporter substrate-binding protein (HAAT family) [Rhodococcus sp. OK302]